MKVLVHYDSYGIEAYGLWWVDPKTGSPQSLYHEPQSPQAARGRIIVFNKSNPDVSWHEWFDQLTTRAPYTEDWIVYDSMGMKPKDLLKALEPIGSMLA